MKQAILIGAPNCGKSSLFRLLTGKRTGTGNRAGVTVEALSAPIPGRDWTLTDLPGLRSVSAASQDEDVTVSYLRAHTPDLVLAVCDATRLAEQYPLLRAFREAYFPAAPAVLILNFCDELEHFPQRNRLSAFPLPILPLSARSGEGIDALRALFLPGTELPSPAPFPVGVPAWLAETVGKTSGARLRRSARWDGILLHPIFGGVFFCLLIAGILWLVFGRFGNFLTDGFLALCIRPLAALSERLPAVGWLRSLLQEGILGGVGAVLGFFPRLLLLFLLQTFLEQSGYLSRAARLFDPLLSRFGLRGDAVTPLLLGFGCTVPAVLCTRGMKDPGARSRCACYLPCVACSARIPLCLSVSDAFFPGRGWWICAALWVFSGMVFLAFCALDTRLRHKTRLPDCHRDALPLLRLPSVSDLVGAACEQLVHFASRAGGLILLTSVGIWLLSRFCPGQAGMVPVSRSALAVVGRALAPLLVPPGLNDWRIVAALLSGIGAKEATLSTLGILLEVQNGNVGGAICASGVLNARSALSFLVFYLFYFPCAATLTVQKRPRRWICPLLFAYLASTLIYRLPFFK